MQLEIGLECKECGARLEAEIIPTMGKENILIAVELCAECIKASFYRGYKKCDNEHECAF